MSKLEVKRVEGTSMLTEKEWRQRVSENYQRALEPLAPRYYSGEHSVLAQCVYLCAIFGIPLPPWARDVWQEAYNGVLTGALPSWDPVLGHVRPRTDQQQRRNKEKHERLKRVMLFAANLGNVPIKRGNPPGSFFALLARDLDTDAHTARKLYYQLPKNIRNGIRQ